MAGAADEVRRAARAVKVHPYDVDTDPRSVLSAEDSALQVLAEREIRALLAVLTPEQRDVLLLRFVADLAVEQCAAVMSRSPDAVKKLQRRAIARLRRELDAAASGARPRPLAGVAQRLQVRHD